MCSLVSFGFIWYTWQCDLKRHDAIPGKDFRPFDCGAMAAKAANIARTVVLSSRLLPETVRTLGLGLEGTTFDVRLCKRNWQQRSTKGIY